MKVYTALAVIQYEGSIFLGVYASEEAARKAVSVAHQKQVAEDGYRAYDWYEIVASELGETVEYFRKSPICIEISELGGV